MHVEEKLAETAAVDGRGGGMQSGNSAKSGFFLTTQKQPSRSLLEISDVKTQPISDSSQAGEDPGLGIR